MRNLYCCLRYLVVLFLLVHTPVVAQNLGSLKNQKVIEIRGSLAANVQFYQANGINNRRQPFTWYLTGTPVVKLFGMTFPFTLVVSEQERRFSQPFNQYGVSPYYKSLKLHLGYRNVRFSDYTLGGANFLGAGAEYTPKNIRLGFVYGQFARPINEDATGQDVRYQYIRPVYQRIGWAAKVGIGSPKSYVDVSVFKAKDIISSITAPSPQSRVLPMENLAVGLKNHFGFFKQKLTFDLDVGASLLTRNSLKRDIENPEPWQNKLLDIVAVNASSNFFTAGTAAMGWRFKKGAIRAIYQRVDPDYQSLGAYYFQNDVEQLTIAPTLLLFKNKLIINGSIGRSHDNLKGNKGATTHRNVSSVNLSMSPIKRLTVGLNYSNFGVGQSRGLGDFFNDSLAVSVVNSSYNATINYSLGSKISQQSFGITATYQNTNDQNAFTRQYTGASSMIGVVTYNFTHIPRKLSSTIALSYVSIETAGKSLLNIGPNVGLSKELPKLKVRVGVNHNSQLRKVDGHDDGIMTNTGLTIFCPLNKQSISVGGNYLYNRYKVQQDALVYRNFSELRATLSYGIRF